MIKNLYIKDFALIESVSLDFAAGLNVIIGETGSGKSMIIDALIIAFGGRASSDLVRNGATKSIIELHLEANNSRINSVLTENEIEIYEDNLIIRREISVKSGTRNFINDTPVTLALIKQVGDLFIDFHGQHDHQSLLNSANHADIVDKSAGLDSLLSEYNIQYSDLKEKISIFKNLISKERKLRDKAEIQKFRLEEINKVNPLENEDEILESELKLHENSETLHSLSAELYSLLYNTDESAWNLMNKSSVILRQLSDIDSSFSDYIKELESAIISIKEIAMFSNSYNSSIEFNPERIEEIRLRLLQLRGLQKKFGSISEIIKLREEIQSELHLVENFDEEKSKLEKEIELLKNQVFSIALKIEERRLEYSQEFSNSIVKSLSALGINNSTFEVSVSRQKSDSLLIHDLKVKNNGEIFELMANGINQIEFFISTNLGESVKPLKQVASGGEVSRIMLSIKNILADKDNIACLVFDEIDTGVSGRIAQMVGQSMNNLAKYHQIIAISHLPQIAAASTQIVLVEKFENDNKTISQAKLLHDDEKIVEIAKMMSGSQISEASIKNAVELIQSIK